MRTRKEGRERAEEKTKGTREPESRGVRRGDSNTNTEMQIADFPAVIKLACRYVLGHLQEGDVNKVEFGERNVF